jgi:hypothetical protein
MNNITQHEQARPEPRAHFAGTDMADKLDHIERNAPVLYYLIQRSGAGHLPGGRSATDAFLRSLPEALFDRLLALAVGFFR